MRKLSLIGISFLCLLICISTANAVPLIYNFSGIVSESTPSVDPLGWLGSQLEVTLTVDSNKDQVWGYDDTLGNVESMYLPDSVRVALDGQALEHWTVDSTYITFSKSATHDYDRFGILLENSTDGISIQSDTLTWAYCHFGDVTKIPLQYGDALMNGDIIWHSEIDNLANQIKMYGLDSYEFSSRAVPEPATMLLLGAGLVGLAGFGRKKFKK